MEFFVMGDLGGPKKSTGFAISRAVKNRTVMFRRNKEDEIWNPNF